MTPFQVRDVSLPGNPVGDVISIDWKPGLMVVRYEQHGTHHNVDVNSIFIDIIPATEAADEP